MFLVFFPLIQLENIGRSIDISKAPSITLLPSSSTFMPFFSPLVVDFLGHVHGQTRMAPGRCTQHVAVISAFPRVPPTSLSWLGRFYRCFVPTAARILIETRNSKSLHWSSEIVPVFRTSRPRVDAPPLSLCPFPISSILIPSPPPLSSPEQPHSLWPVSITEIAGNWVTE